MVNTTNNVWRLLWSLIYQWFYTILLHFCIVHIILIFRKEKNNNNNNKTNEKGKLKKY